MKESLPGDGARSQISICPGRPSAGWGGGQDVG